MSALIGHAKAAMILATTLTEEATEELAADHPNLTVVSVLVRMSSAHLRAANQMEQAMRAEATGREDQP